METVYAIVSRQDRRTIGLESYGLLDQRNRWRFVGRYRTAGALTSVYVRLAES
jgi:hypothetical protein